MSTTTDDGGSAFPTFIQSGDSSITNGGLTVRDYFANEVMKITLAQAYKAEVKISDARIATESYRLADAMLKARAS